MSRSYKWALQTQLDRDRDAGWTQGYDDATVGTPHLRESDPDVWSHKSDRWREGYAVGRFRGDLKVKGLLQPPKARSHP